MSHEQFSDHVYVTIWSQNYSRYDYSVVCQHTLISTITLLQLMDDVAAINRWYWCYQKMMLLQSKDDVAAINRWCCFNQQIMSQQSTDEVAVINKMMLLLSTEDVDATSRWSCSKSTDDVDASADAVDAYAGLKNMRSELECLFENQQKQVSGYLSFHILDSRTFDRAGLIPIIVQPTEANPTFATASVAWESSRGENKTFAFSIRFKFSKSCSRVMDLLQYFFLLFL